MDDFNILALVSAGLVTEDDNTLGIIQNISREHAHSIAKWLVIATGKKVHLQLINFTGGEEIRYTPEQVQTTIKQQPVNR